MAHEHEPHEETVGTLARVLELERPKQPFLGRGHAGVRHAIQLEVGLSFTRHLGERHQPRLVEPLQRRVNLAQVRLVEESRRFLDERVQLVAARILVHAYQT